MVNSDQTWRKFDENFYDYGFLKFAEKWNKKKFVYSASMGAKYDLSLKDEIVAKNLLKHFTGISVREKGLVDIVSKRLGITPEFVLDPTLLIDIKYYFQIIKNFTPNNRITDNYIFVYLIFKDENLNRLINRASKELNYKVNLCRLNNKTTVEEFIYYINNSKAVITDSYHGTIFSIIFNKPFISFNFQGLAEERFKSLLSQFGIINRIFKKYNPDLNLLKKPLNINYELLYLLRNKSINFLKKNLGVL